MFGTKHVENKREKNIWGGIESGAFGAVALENSRDEEVYSSSCLRFWQ